MFPTHLVLPDLGLLTPVSLVRLRKSTSNLRVRGGKGGLVFEQRRLNECKLCIECVLKPETLKHGIRASSPSLPQGSKMIAPRGGGSPAKLFRCSAKYLAREHMCEIPAGRTTFDDDVLRGKANFAHKVAIARQSIQRVAGKKWVAPHGARERSCSAQSTTSSSRGYHRC